MEDELEQEGMEDEVGKPQPEKSKGNPTVKFGIIGVIFVVVVYLVFFSGLNPFLGGEPVEEEAAEVVVENILDTEYGVEYHIQMENGIVHSMLDDNGRVKNLVIHATLITEKDKTAFFEKRGALIEYLIKVEFNRFSGNNFKKLLEQQYQDSLMILIAEKINMNMPPEEKIWVKRVILSIITM